MPRTTLGIFKVITKSMTTSYTHTFRAEIEKYMNQDEWIEGSLQEVEEQVISTLILKTPFLVSKQKKRVREETPHSKKLMK